MKQVHATEIEEVRDVFEGMGVTKAWELENDDTNQIASNPKAILEFMMSFELKARTG